MSKSKQDPNQTFNRFVQKGKGYIESLSLMEGLAMDNICAAMFEVCQWDLKDEALAIKVRHFARAIPRKERDELNGLLDEIIAGVTGHDLTLD
ncbi:MAG: hypothetical protein GY696_40430 [Gammaproteobacteria bacterium]|nr:hypothetical protein [Gammaproteobacteria bacterium]MCP4994860.1 hypothetical protein [Gammaproteobacteria bacterium]